MGLPNTLKTREADKLATELGAHDSLDAATGVATRLLDKLRALDLHSFEGMVADNAVLNLSVGPITDLVRMLNESVRLLRSLPRLVGGEALNLELDYHEPMFDLEGAIPKNAVDGKPAPMHDHYAQDLDAALKVPNGSQDTRAEDVRHFAEQCETMVTSLKSVLDFIREARRERNKWALITAGEEGRRKAQKSLRAAFILGTRLTKPALAGRLFPQDSSELETALRVRAAMLSYREDMLKLAQDGGTLNDVELALHLRDVRIRMLQLFSERYYRDLRAPDRYDLQALFGRLNKWLDVPWEDFATARGVLAALGAHADGLSMVNNRDLLVDHDRALRDAAVTKLATLNVTLNGTDHWRSYASALESLKALQGRSRELDAMVLGELDRGAGQASELQGRIANTKAAIESLEF